MCFFFLMHIDVEMWSFAPSGGQDKNNHELKIQFMHFVTLTVTAEMC